MAGCPGTPGDRLAQAVPGIPDTMSRSCHLATVRLVSNVQWATHLRHSALTYDPSAPGHRGRSGSSAWPITETFRFTQPRGFLSADATWLTPDTEGCSGVRVSTGCATKMSPMPPAPAACIGAHFLSSRYGRRRTARRMTNGSWATSAPTRSGPARLQLICAPRGGPPRRVLAGDDRIVGLVCWQRQRACLPIRRFGRRLVLGASTARPQPSSMKRRVGLRQPETPVVSFAAPSPDRDVDRHIGRCEC